MTKMHKQSGEPSSGIALISWKPLRRRRSRFLCLLQTAHPTDDLIALPTQLSQKYHS